MFRLRSEFSRKGALRFPATFTKNGQLFCAVFFIAVRRRLRLSAAETQAGPFFAGAAEKRSVLSQRARVRTKGGNLGRDGFAVDLLGVGHSKLDSRDQISQWNARLLVFCQQVERLVLGGCSFDTNAMDTQNCSL